ncbi:MAG TPA: PAS domain S-box protein [Acidimicrobiales bacterium]|nr:PAS domain S-box protein [Acidimicrobiales bacterium]
MEDEQHRYEALLEMTERALEESRRNEARLAEAQRVGSMGSYDWHIVIDSNSWSDELYRIYGTEPQSFNASYEKFIEFIHPDDREKVKAVHMHAFQTHEPYHMEERIVRPTGEVRILDSYGEVAVDDDGNPIRMYGICRDITEQRRAEEEAQRVSARFASLVEASPDALIVVDRAGAIHQVNERSEELFGYAPEELIGQQIEILIPERLTLAHRVHRAAYMGCPVARPMGTALEVIARRKDGTEVPVDISLGVLRNGEATLVAAFVRDITERKRAAEFALRLHDAEVRRRHALEINDNVVQGLSAALYAFEAGYEEAAHGALQRTITSARLMMNDLLAGTDNDFDAGELERARPAVPALPELPAAEDRSRHLPVHRVLLVDDARDIRVLLRRVFNADGSFEVVGEAVDGQAAIALADELTPDVVVLDLAMPVMDGLEALPVIRHKLPNAKIVVLSGFDGARMRQPALLAGADAYIEKGGSLLGVLSTINQMLPAAV